MREHKEERREYIQWLMNCREISGKTCKRLLERFEEPGELFSVRQGGLTEWMPERQAGALEQYMRETKEITGIREQYEKMKKQGIFFVTVEDEGYPEKLKEIPDAPLGIYYKGKLPAKNCLAVAIIGSRDCSEYGSRVAAKLGRSLGERGIPVISGMARGIDGISQQAAIEAGGESYGVLGCGVDICYPQSNQKLYQKLLERGGLLSTYPPGTQPMPKNFPPRNRIVSGLAMAVVVVEAALRSGTSITVSMALEQGRDVYAVPGRITDRLSEGCNKLIKQGAEVYLDPESFIEELQETYFLQCISPMKKRRDDGESKEGESGEFSRNSECEKHDLSSELMQIWEVLDETPKTVEEIKALIREEIPLSVCSVRLMELTLSGKAKQVSGGYFCRS